jgi:hypothetical protein
VSSPFLEAVEACVFVGFGEPSACSEGAGVFGTFAGARGTLGDFFDEL